MTTPKLFVVCFVLLVALTTVVQAWAFCPNDCSHRGLCINGACVCAEGLTGNDCSQTIASTIPSLYQCPQCYSVTVGPAQYISGPSWRLPDGPIAGLNYRGNLSVYMGNGNGEMISSGTYVDDYIPSVIALSAGTKPNFDSCGSWLLRAITSPVSGKVIGFYHAEKDCTYPQTRKSGGVSYSSDGGRSFQKPNYPNNRILDSATQVLAGMPSGEGDFSIVVRDGYYYMFFQNVEDFHIGVARATKASDANPGSFYKYNNGQWNSAGVGGASARLDNVAGTQVYLHTPSQSFLSVGNNHPYWNQGSMMSASDDGIKWNYIADPIFTPDPVTNTDQIMYSSFLGPTGGYDVGSNFKFYYMWVAPGATWQKRYQIAKDVTLTYVGPNNKEPLSKIALTTYKSAATGELWQTTELADSPYNPVGIVGYLMSRSYPYTFVVYDCFNYTTNDHFVGTAEECLIGTGVQATRVMGYLWHTRVAKSIAVYRCRNGKDTFISANTNCDGLAPSQIVPFGYVQDGPAFTQTEETVIFQGSSWKYKNYTSPSLVPATWKDKSFDDSAWLQNTCPFGASYSTAKSYFGPTNYYFRYHFQIPSGKVVKKLMASIASDDYATIYLNGVQVDVDTKFHEASYWNRRVFLDTAAVVSGENVLSPL